MAKLERMRQFLRGIIAVAAASAVLATAGVAGAEIPEDRLRTTRAEDVALTFHHLERASGAVERFSSRARPAIDRLSEALGLESFPEVDVWLLPEVRDYFAYRGLDGAPPEWAVGLSFRGQQRIVVALGAAAPTAGRTLGPEKTFVHELAHVAVDAAAGDAHVPRWLDEGFALMHADEWTPTRSEKLARAASTGSLTPLTELSDSFPGHHNVASLAYAESYHAVRFLTEAHGDDVVARLAGPLDRGTAFPDAFDRATGESLASFQHRWRESIEGETSWLTVFREDTAFFFAFGVIFAIAWIVRRLRSSGGNDSSDPPPEEWDYDASRYPLPGGES